LAKRWLTASAKALESSGSGRPWCVSDNRRLADACHWWAFAALTKSPAPEHTRAAGDTYNAALRNLANKLIAKLFYCLQNNTPYAESSAWSTPNDADVKTSLLDR
jgi:hypothetical protein